MPILTAGHGNLRKIDRMPLQGLAMAASWATVATLVAWSTWTGVSSTLLALVCGGLLLAAIWGRPRLALTVWMVSLVMVPVWVSVDLFATVPAHCIVALLAIAAAMGSRTRNKIKFSRFDSYFALFLVVSLAAVLVGGSTWASWAQILLRWGIPFLAARILVSATGTRFAVNAIAILFGIVGVLAAIELLLVWHPFVGWDSGTLEFKIWHVIQTRNGVDRSEWAFGHSIALGGSLVLSIPFIIRSSGNGFTKAALLVAVAAGITATASRGAVIAALFTVAIYLLYSAKKGAVRTAALTLAIPAIPLAFLFFVPLVETLARGGSGEEQGSFDYRNYLYSTYAPTIEWFGRSPLYNIATGTLSIDSEVLNIGLAFGWLVLAGAVIPFALSAVRIINGRATVAEVAIVGQIPLFVSVALITQYESIFFLVVGVAVQMSLATRASLMTINKDDAPSSMSTVRDEPSCVARVPAYHEAKGTTSPSGGSDA